MIQYIWDCMNSKNRRLKENYALNYKIVSENYQSVLLFCCHLFPKTHKHIPNYPSTKYDSRACGAAGNRAVHSSSYRVSHGSCRQLCSYKVLLPTVHCAAFWEEWVLTEEFRCAQEHVQASHTTHRKPGFFALQWNLNRAALSSSTEAEFFSSTSLPPL